MASMKDLGHLLVQITEDEMSTSYNLCPAELLSGSPVRNSASVLGNMGQQSSNPTFPM